MTVVVDTCVWSVAFRRRKQIESAVVDELGRLIKMHAVAMIGNVRQELLSGIADPKQFERARSALNDFPNFPLEIEDYERAAEFDNACRRKGVQGAPTDFLLCAVAERRQMEVFTTDRDFAHFARHISVQLHMPDLLDR